jgi:pilus assembly protein CpaB
VSRRVRAVLFALLALVCAGLAAALASGYRSGVEAQLGELRPVLVTRGDVPEGRVLSRSRGRKLLEVRRVPTRFVPTDALAAPEQAVGREPLGPIPAGSYVLASHLKVPRPDTRQSRPAIPSGREPVDIAVSGAEALSAAGPSPAGRRVDVIVTTEARAGGEPGRTYVAAERVTLIGLREGGDLAAEDPLQAGPATWVATLALKRRQALRLIQAQNYAREVRLIPRSPAPR